MSNSSRRRANSDPGSRRITKKKSDARKSLSKDSLGKSQTKDKGETASSDRALSPKLPITPPPSRRASSSDLTRDKNITRSRVLESSEKLKREIDRKDKAFDDRMEANISEIDFPAYDRTEADFSEEDFSEEDFPEEDFPLEDIPVKATPEQLKDLLHFSRPSPFLKGRRAAIRPMLDTLFNKNKLGCGFDTAIATKNSLYSMREARLQELQQLLENALTGNGEDLHDLLASNTPVSEVLLQNPEALRLILRNLPNTKENYDTIEQIENLLNRQENSLPETVKAVFQQKKAEMLKKIFEVLASDPKDSQTKILKTLFDDLECSLDQLFVTREGIYALKESKLQRRQTRLQKILKRDNASAEQLFLLLSEDNPFSRVILKSPKALQKLIDKLPNTEESHIYMELLESLLLKQQNPDMPLTIGLHEICFRKKTEILETMIATKLSTSDKPELQPLKNLGKENYWKILIDGNVHKHNNKHFYDRSRGFMASMMKGLRQVVEEIDRQLDTNFIKELHTAATELVVDETKLPLNAILPIIKSVKGVPENEPLPGHINDLMKDLTQEQKAEVEKRKAKIAMYPNQFQERGIKDASNEWGVTRTYTPKGMDELKTLREELDQQAGMQYFSDGDMHFPNDENVVAWRAGRGLDSNLLKSKVEELMGYVVTKAYQEIKTAKENEDQDALIGAIIDCCRRLGIIHPFRDANGRLIMFLILNKLLMEQGLSPTILPDQGLMVGKSKAELIDLIKEGQEQVKGMKKL